MVSMSGLIAGEISVLLLNDLLRPSEQQTLVSRLFSSVVLVAVPGLLVVSAFQKWSNKEKRSTCMVLKCGLSSEQSQIIQVKQVHEQI